MATSGTIELYFYGELTAPERVQFEQHAAVCGECGRAIDDLTVIRAALAARPVVTAPPADDWSGFMSRLQHAIERDPGACAGLTTITRAVPAHRGSASATVQGTVHVGPGSTRARRSPIEYIAMAALLALVTTSVAFLAHARGALTTLVPAAADRNGGSARAEDAGLTELSEEHFERSKLVVLGLAAKDPQRATSSDWTYERQLAASLLSDTRMYRLAAEDRGLRSIAGVMRDLELVLLQTSLTDETDAASLAQIQRLIRKRDLIEKMDALIAG